MLARLRLCPFFGYTAQHHPGLTQQQARAPQNAKVQPVKRWLLGISVILIVALAWTLWQGIFAGYGSWLPLPAKPPTQFKNYSAFNTVAVEEVLLRHHQDNNLVGITAAVGVGDKVVWTGAVGWASLNPARPITDESMLRVGSTSKAITATLLAKLVDRGEISLEAPISDYGEWPNPEWLDLTSRQLASHTAGLSGYETNSDLAGLWLTICGCKRYTTVKDSLEIFDDSPLLFEPGTDFSYSSFDVNILGAVIANTQNRSYNEVLSREVLTPLNLTHTVLAESPAQNLVEFHDTKPGYARTWRPFDLTQRWPSGGIVSRSVDLVQIGLAWLDPDFISSAVRQMMWTPQSLADGTVNEQNYAIGWRFGSTRADDARRYAHHGGVSKGAMSWLVVYPDAQLAVAVNINSHAETFQQFASVEKKITEFFLTHLQQLQ